MVKLSHPTDMIFSVKFEKIDNGNYIVVVGYAYPDRSVPRGISSDIFEYDTREEAETTHIYLKYFLERNAEKMSEKKTALQKFIHRSTSVYLNGKPSQEKGYTLIIRLAEALDKDLSAMNKKIDKLSVSNLGSLSRAEREQLKILRNDK